MSVNDASTIIVDNSRVMLQIVVSLTDDPTGIIYDFNMFIVTVYGDWLNINILANLKQGTKWKRFSLLEIWCRNET
jgi:hypothetical protein